MKANIGITEKNSQEIALILNKLLADEFVLYAKTRNYHWNYEGDNFMEMHKFFEELYTELEDVIDEIAERVRKIGHYAEARLQEYLKLTDLTEPSTTTKQGEQVKNLLDDNETLCRYIRERIKEVEKLNDVGTVDYLTQLIQKHEKAAWMLRAYLKK